MCGGAAGRRNGGWRVVGEAAVQPCSWAWFSPGACPRPGAVLLACSSGINPRAPWEQAALEAMAVAFTELKLVLEPSGALGLAALLAGRIPVAPGDVVAVVACGGNVSLPEFLKLLS